MANKNESKRVPKSAVFSIGVDKADSGSNILGFIEGDIAITSVKLVVTEAFDGTTPTITVTDTQGGTTETHFTAVPLGVEIVDTSAAIAPSGLGTATPLYRSTKGQWDCELVSGGSTAGEVCIVVDYTQLDTEPGLHSLEDN